MEEKHCIAVVMSTYNGEQFLSEQIYSILEQSNVDVELFIRDDGSTDDTQSIIKDFQKRYKNIHFIEDCQNMGITGSFLSALEYAYGYEQNFSYFSFADQDDYWLPRKLYEGIKLIKDSQNIKGALYYSNKTFVDEKLNSIYTESITFYDDYMEVLWKSLASGCTMIFNRTLAGYILKYKPDVKTLHDSWLYRVSKCIGSDIFFDNKSYILYRQHENNVCGRDATIILNFSLNNVYNAILRRFQKREHLIQGSINEIYRMAYNDMTSEAIELSKIVINYNSNMINRFKMLNFKYLNKRPFSMKVLWVDKVLNGMI